MLALIQAILLEIVFDSQTQKNKQDNGQKLPPVYLGESDSEFSSLGVTLN